MKNPYLLHKRGKVWYYRLAGQHTFHSTGQTTKANANEYCLRLLNGETPQRISASKTLRDACEGMFVPSKCRWIKRKERRGKSVSPEMATMRRGHLVNYILDKFGSRTPASITQNELDDWLTSLSLAEKTRNHILDTARIVWKELKNDGYVSVNISEGIERFAKIQNNRDIFTEAELEFMFPHDPADSAAIWGDVKWAGLFVVLAQTGMRLGEALALQWQDIVRAESGNAFFHIHKAVKNEKRRIGTTKNGKSRVAPVMAGAWLYLHRWREASPFAKDTDLIFPNTSGNPLQTRLVADKFKNGLTRAGINTSGRNLVTHSFRHTFNTLYRKTLDDAVLQQLTGHTSEEMINTYDHPDVRSMVESVDAHQQSITNRWAQIHPSQTTSDSTAVSSNGPTSVAAWHCGDSDNEERRVCR